MNKFVQLELFDLSTHILTDADSQESNILFFQFRPKVMYEQLSLDLGLEPPNDDQSLDPAEAA